MFEFSCVIENVRHCRGGSGKIEMADYSGKLLMIWDKYKQYKHHPEKKIWCALIAFEKRNNDDEVWGKVEWANIVRTVPNSCVLLRSEIQAV
ncbi:unnamed protein product [Brassica oleracea]